MEYLVYELARLDAGIPQEGTQFPIDDKRESFESHIKRGWLKGIHAGHIAAIEALQPYRGCNWTKTLRDLSNPDKHCELVGIQGHFSGTAHTRLNDPRFDGVLAPMTRAIHPLHGEVDVKFFYSEEIQFADGAPVIQTLETLQSQVASTIDAFKPEF